LHVGDGRKLEVLVKTRVEQEILPRRSAALVAAAVRG
jgi:hypothetical protein